MKTFILKWNPTISSIDMGDMHWEMETNVNRIDGDFDWSVCEWEKVEKGDRVFMLLVGQKKDNGIVGSGWFSSEPYEDRDWAGTDKKRHYAKIVWDVLLHPDCFPVLDQAILQKEIPDVEWWGGHSGVVISDDDAAKLEALWKAFVDEHESHIKEECAEDGFISLVGKAYGIAINAHKGQVDKGGKDYFSSHIYHVCKNVEPIFDDNDLCVSRIVALLHDVVEDTPWTFEQLKAEGFPDSVIDALRCVTKQEGEDYEHFVDRCMTNDAARAVKISDLKSNMDITRLNEITDKDVERLRKYLKAYKKLEMRCC